MLMFYATRVAKTRIALATSIWRTGASRNYVVGIGRSKQEIQEGRLSNAKATVTTSRPRDFES